MWAEAKFLLLLDLFVDGRREILKTLTLKNKENYAKYLIACSKSIRPSKYMLNRASYHIKEPIKSIFSSKVKMYTTKYQCNHRRLCKW